MGRMSHFFLSIHPSSIGHLLGEPLEFLLGARVQVVREAELPLAALALEARLEGRGVERQGADVVHRRDGVDLALHLS